MATEGMPWPPPNNQLEKWMMNTIKEGDHAAQLMRSILNMNPAFGVYLQEDQDLVSVVQIFAKRLRKIALSEGGGMGPTVLYQPLCELVWRVVGLTMHSMINLEDQAAMPAVKEAKGMIKMLLRTNTELSSQLSHLRRKYFKELTAYRDKSRRLSKEAEAAIANLNEQPVMFFEPLEFVLDETTKSFVREAIEERMKLELRTTFVQEETGPDLSGHLDALEKELQDAQAKIRVLNNTVARDAEARKRHEEVEERLRNEIKALRAGDSSTSTVIDDLNKDIDKHKKEIVTLQERIVYLEQNQGSGVVEKIVEKEVRVEVVKEINGGNDALNKEMERLKKELSKKDNEIKDLTKEVKSAQAAIKDKGIKEVVKEKKVYVEDTESKAALEKSLEVEKQLREALKAMELRAKEAESAEPKVVTVEKVVESDKPVKVKKDKTDEKIAAAIAKCTEEFQGRIKSLADKLHKCKAELEEKEALLAEMMGDGDAAKAAAKKAAAEAARLAAEGEDMAKWRVKYHELEDKYEALQDEYAKIQSQVRSLLDKMRENMSEEEIKETMMKIQMEAPPPRKRRKKKAYERLYDDAQRRIVEMRMKQEKLKELEQRSLRRAVSKVYDRQSLRKAEVLTHLHKAKAATTERFQEALSEFHSSVPDRPRRGNGEDPDDFDMEDSSDPETAARMHALHERVRDGSPGQSTHSLPPDMVCPRCGYHTTSLYGKQSPASTGPAGQNPPWRMASTSPFGSGSPFNASGGPFNASGGPFNASGGPFNASGGQFNASGGPWTSSQSVSMPIMGRQLVQHSGSAGSLGGNASSIPRRDHANAMALGVFGERTGSPGRARALSPASNSRAGDMSPQVVASQGPGRSGPGMVLSASSPNLRGVDAPIEKRARPEPLEPLSANDQLLVQSMGSPPATVKFGRRANEQDGPEGGGGMATVSMASQALFPNHAPPWRSEPNSGTRNKSPGQRNASPDKRTPSPARLMPTNAQGMSTDPVGIAGSSLQQVQQSPQRSPKPQRSPSPGDSARKLEPVGENSAVSSDKPPAQASISAPSNSSWFGLQATPPWRRGSGARASDADSQAGGGGAQPSGGPRGAPAVAGRGVRTATDWTSGAPARARGPALDPINRQVSFAGLDVSPRHRAAQGGSSRSPSPMRAGAAGAESQPASKSDGFVKKKLSNDSELASPSRLGSAPARDRMSDPEALQRSLEYDGTGSADSAMYREGSTGSGRAGDRGSMGALGGGGRGHKYGDVHSQQLPTVSAVRPHPAVLVQGAGIQAELLRTDGAPWEPLRQPPTNKGSKSVEKLRAAGDVVKAINRMTSFKDAK